MNRRRLVSGILTVAMACTMVTPALASNEELKSSDLTLEILENQGGNPEIIQVTVPAVLPLVMQEDGSLLVPSDAKIENNSADKNLEVTKLEVLCTGSWVLSDNWEDDSQVNNTLSLKFRGDIVSETGNTTLTTGNWEIPSSQDLQLSMEAKVVTEQKAQPATKIAEIQFTIGILEEPIQDNTKTITIVPGENGEIVGDIQSIQTDIQGIITNLPDVNPDDGYIFDKWINVDTGEEVSIGDSLSDNIQIKPIFTQDPSTQPLFTQSNGVITGFSDYYTGLSVKPEDLVIPSELDGVSITSIGDSAFKEATAKSIEIPEGVVSIGNSAFQSANIDTIILPVGVETIGDSAFESCTATTIDIKDGLKSIGTRAFILTSITSINLPAGLETLGTFAFNSSKLVDLTLPSSIKDVGRNSFGGCENLGNVVLEEGIVFDKTQVFSGSTIEHITLPNGLTSIPESTFTNCRINSELIIPDTVESIGDMAFTYTSGNEDTSNVYTSINIPANVKHIGTGAFGYSYFTDITLNKGIETLGENVFHYSKIKSIEIPDGVEIIPERTFAYCSDLETVKLPDSVNEIGRFAFRNCASLDINIPYNVKYLNNDHFLGCSGLTINIDHPVDGIPGAPWGVPNSTINWLRG